MECPKSYLYKKFPENIHSNVVNQVNPHLECSQKLQRLPGPNGLENFIKIHSPHTRAMAHTQTELKHNASLCRKLLLLK